MNPAVTLVSIGAAGTAFALGLALGRRLISPVRLAQIIGGLGCGLALFMAAVLLATGGGHG